MTLFFVNDSDDSGDNWDLLIWADNPDEAVLLWRGYYGMETNVFPRTMFSIPIHPPAESYALRWHRDVNECDIPTKEAAIALGLCRAYD